jgi:selenide,water dikinase
MQVLHQLPASSHPDLLVGAEHASDAGVFRLRPDLAIVQTTDFFPPLVDDPFTFGQIAAANSLSDCFAMGATPVTCLNIVCFPDKDLPVEVLQQILAGGADKVAEAGAVIVGGHSLRDAEIKYGLAVTGTVHPDRFMTNAGARPGDHLILTKPIGSGILASAAKTGKITPEVYAEAIDVMKKLNAAASRVAMELGIRGCTDITGFGLIGHAFEMADASNVTLEIRAGAVPLIGPTLDLARQGVITRAFRSTLEYIGPRLRFDDDVDPPLLHLLADAQTSGGLLISVPESRADDLLTWLHREGVREAVEIGRVLPPDKHRIHLIV